MNFNFLSFRLGQYFNKQSDRPFFNLCMYDCTYNINQGNVEQKTMPTVKIGLKKREIVIP